MNALARLAVPSLLIAACATESPATVSDAADTNTRRDDAPAASERRPASERAKIDRLLSVVRTSGIVFIRNGKDHDASAAADHLATKLGHAGSDISAKQFIDELATKSSMSGELYQVRLPDGTTTPAGKWLHARLAEIEAAP